MKVVIVEDNARHRNDDRRCNGPLGVVTNRHAMTRPLIVKTPA